MSTVIDQKAYLQKYLTGKSSDKKKKKKKPVKGKGFKIIDDDLDLSKLRPLDIDELDILNEGEDAPQIAGIIDERPEEIRKLEDFKTSSKWRVINQDDGFNSKLQVEEVKRSNKEIEKENEIVFGKMYSDSEDENKNDSDPSPPRKHSEKNQTKKPSNSNPNDSDVSPPRRKDKSKDKNYDSDQSPPRHSKKTQNNRSNCSGSDASPPRNHKKRRNSDSDASPPRKQEKSSHISKNHNTKSKSYDSDVSPPRKREKNSQSSKNYNTKSYDSDVSPPRKREKSSKTDENYTRKSSPRQENKRVRKTTRWGDFDSTEYKKSSRSRSRERSNKSNKARSPEKSDRYTNKQKSRTKDYDSDLSPPRKSKRQSDSDASPPRKKQDKRKVDKYRNNTSPKRSEKHKRANNDSDSDLSPPRRDRNTKDISPSRKKSLNGRDYNDEPPPSNKKMEKTLEGKRAGLQDAGQLKEENQAFRIREDEAFKNLTDEMSGRNAKAVSRRSKRETSEDRQKQREKAERQKELDEKYKKWSKGIKQIEAQQAAVQDFIHESSKPLARYKDDRDLEDKLKDVERDGDPMLQYIRERKRERGELGPEKPTYKGNFPPNRFNIRPGYRWDGVDRSNGYEKKYFDQQSKRKAQEEEVYKWSTEDL